MLDVEVTVSKKNVLTKLNLFISAGLIVLVIILILLFKPHANDTYYNGIKVNDTADKITDKMGEPLRRAALANATELIYNNVSFAVSKGNVVGFTTSDKTYKTNKGITVGSTISDLVKVYDKQNLKHAGDFVYCLNSSEDIVYVFHFIPYPGMDGLYDTSAIKELGVTQYTNQLGEGLVNLPELEYKVNDSIGTQEK